MPAKTPRQVENRLLQGLPEKDLNPILDQCQQVDLAFGTVLCEPGQPLLHVYFPSTAFISLMTTLSGHPPLEIGLVGYEGMLGATLALGANTAPCGRSYKGPAAACEWSVHS